MMEKFINLYTEELEKRIASGDPDYVYLKQIGKDPREVATKVANGLVDGTANLGPAAKSALKKLGIKPTYKALKEALTNKE